MGLAAFPGIHVGDVRDEGELFNDVSGRLRDSSMLLQRTVWPPAVVSGHSCL